MADEGTSRRREVHSTILRSRPGRVPTSPELRASDSNMDAQPGGGERSSVHGPVSMEFEL
jgi:hypothetical protein